MKDVHEVDDLEHVKVLADPLRLRLLEALAEGPATTKQVAGMLGEKPTKLYHHVEALERIGFIKLVGMRQNRGTIEKYFEPIARQFTIKHDLLSSNGSAGVHPDLVRIIGFALEETAAEIRASGEAGLLKTDNAEDTLAFSRFQITGTRSEITAALKKLRAWIGETKKMQKGSGDAEYGITVAFYPVKGKKRRTKK